MEKLKYLTTYLTAEIEVYEGRKYVFESKQFFKTV